MAKFFSRLNYSFGNEDWRTERKALQVKPGDSVLCITASGDRPLHLLLDDCQHVTTVDANPIQNHLCSLKCAALQTLDYHQYVSFLGGSPCHQRDRIFYQLANQLPSESVTFWLDHFNMIKEGVLYQGCVERLTKNVAALTRLLRPRKVKKLFQIDNLEEQRKFVQSEWNTFFMRKAFEIGLSRSLCALFAVDPGLYSHSDPSLSLGSYIYNRMINSLTYCLAKDNLLVSLLFRGFVEQKSFPPYLQNEGFNVIKSRISRLSIQTCDIIQYLEKAPANSFDCFSLSDVASYISREDFNRLIKNIYRTAKPGARFCIRQFSSNHIIPPEMEGGFQRNHALEQQLEREDRCFVYRFMTGKLYKESSVLVSV